MPGGIGPVSGEMERLLSHSERPTHLGVNATPVQIFYNLGVGQVHYLPSERLLYFVESPNTPIVPMVRQACFCLSSQPEAEQLFLDRHSLIKGATRMQLTQEQANTILVALRLAGIRISIAEE